MGEEGRDLAEWLQETARRDAVLRAHPVRPPATPGTVAARNRTFAAEILYRHRQLIALASVTAAYLQYYFIGVMTEIYSLSGPVIFLPHSLG
jgi:hypothetical protein